MTTVTISRELASRALTALENRHHRVINDPNIRGKDGIAKILQEGLAADESAIAELRAALDQTSRDDVSTADAITDTQRLDWLEKSRVCAGGDVWLKGGIGGKHCSTLRAAIDAAIQQEKP